MKTPITLGGLVVAIILGSLLLNWDAGIVVPVLIALNLAGLIWLIKK